MKNTETCDVCFALPRPVNYGEQRGDDAEETEE
jgi:hypothetical protein